MMRRAERLRTESEKQTPRTLRESDAACRLGDLMVGAILEDTPEAGAVWAAERVRGTLLASDVWDDLKKVINNYKPRTLVISTPETFRRALADLIDDLQRATAESAAGC